MCKLWNNVTLGACRSGGETDYRASILNPCECLNSDNIF